MTGLNEPQAIISCRNCTAFIGDLIEVVDGQPIVTRNNYCYMWDADTVPDGYCHRAEPVKGDEH